ncbi:hypothetical protein SESBI_42969 [Sesbania bispinosa]|nr:hypothetical protein SESBI_42969 [Sesbania bispinosa]
MPFIYKTPLHYRMTSFTTIAITISPSLSDTFNRCHHRRLTGNTTIVVLPNIIHFYLTPSTTITTSQCHSSLLPPPSPP